MGSLQNQDYKVNDYVEIKIGANSKILGRVLNAIDKFNYNVLAAVCDSDSTSFNFCVLEVNSNRLNSFDLKSL